MIKGCRRGRQATSLVSWRGPRVHKSVGEDGEIVGGFAESFKTLHRNARTEFDPAPSCHLNSVGRCCWIGRSVGVRPESVLYITSLVMVANG